MNSLKVSCECCGRELNRIYGKCYAIVRPNSLVSYLFVRSIDSACWSYENSKYHMYRYFCPDSDHLDRALEIIWRKLCERDPNTAQKKYEKYEQLADMLRPEKRIQDCYQRMVKHEKLPFDDEDDDEEEEEEVEDESYYVCL
jgi:hypothetical protein